MLLFNHAESEYKVAVGDRIAQLVLERVRYFFPPETGYYQSNASRYKLCMWLIIAKQIYTPEVVEVEDLEESLRGAGGFGSTG